MTTTKEIGHVLALRAGEYLGYWPMELVTRHWLLERFPGSFVYLVSLLETPKLPDTKHDTVWPLGVACLGWYPVDTPEFGDAAWGWLHLESTTKEVIGNDLVEGGIAPGQWYYMVLSMVPFPDEGRANDKQKES